MEPALPQAEPQTVEPFEIAFDYDDNHCSWGVDQALEDLDQQLVNELLTEAGEGRYDDDHVHELLIARAKALEAQAAELDVDDENYDENYDRLTAQAVELTDAASRLTYCTDFCCCASDDFSTESDYFDELLSSLGSHTWGVIDRGGRRGDEADTDLTGQLNLADLTSGSRLREWSSMTAKWDGTKVEFELNGRDGYYGRDLVPLSKDQEELHEDWSEYEQYDDGLAGRLVMSDEGALRVALDLFRFVDQAHESFTLDLDGLIAAVVALPPERRTTIDAPVFSAVVTAGSWSGNETELLTTIMVATEAA